MDMRHLYIVNSSCRAYSMPINYCILVEKINMADMHKQYGYKLLDSA